jgi:hypothetical protein
MCATVGSANAEHRSRVSRQRFPVTGVSTDPEGDSASSNDTRVPLAYALAGLTVTSEPATTTRPEATVTITRTGNDGVIENVIELLVVDAIALAELIRAEVQAVTR